MPAKFPGFPKEGLDFLKALQKNNDREWFNPRKEIFETQVKAPMVALIDAVNSEIAQFDPEYLTEPKKAIYRIYRDTRFSSDKTPYKTHLGASLFRQGYGKDEAPGYYFSVGATQIEIAAGVYQPPPELLLQLRQYISANGAAFAKLATDKKVTALAGELQGDTLRRPPKGFSADDPAIEWVKRKGWYYYSTTSLPVETAGTPKLLPELMKRFKAMAPLVAFFNRGLKRKASASDFLV